MTRPSVPPSFEVRAADWLHYREARDRVLACVRPTPRERASLDEALGRALAEDVSAPATLPPWDNAAMDGYAVRAGDVRGASPEAPAVLTVVGLARAGGPAPPAVGPREAVRIMTGAPVPVGADSVVRVEDTDGEAASGTVRIRTDRDAGRNVRPGGEDVRAGEAVLPAGHTIRPGSVGTLAALGRREVEVRARPRVAILVTGDELIPPERYQEVLAGAGVPESNGPMLAAQARQAGAVPRLMDVAPDRLDALVERLRAARSADAVVTVGGASMGEVDLVKRALDRLAYEPAFWRVRIRPGSPFSFGHLPDRDRRVPVFGLPGNPASAFVTFELFARPFLLAAAGHRRVLRPVVRCVAGPGLSGPADLACFPRVTVSGGPDGRLRAEATGPQGSGLVGRLGAADGLAVLPEGVGSVAEGAPVDVMLLDGLGSGGEAARGARPA